MHTEVAMTLSLTQLYSIIADKNALLAWISVILVPWPPYELCGQSNPLRSCTDQNCL